ncbi:hypothetical protein Nepgr_008265 [Nepenthes gracilis]|uniref:HTH myb-type domain-containing protein n=1 Tax=Nepenthes gracilis TaxID=150966 RepID=A0AAD3S8E9_NEPGR|nr:hypothetical protein Nepgr_008265 [Nepenthes gracilis]
MELNSPKLNLDLSPPCVHPQTISDFVPHVSIFTKAISDSRSAELNNYISGLQDELKKIEAFKREFPLSILLLNDVINYLKEEGRKGRVAESRKMMQEVSPSKVNSNGNGSVELETDQSDKRTWMSSAQLWSSSNLTDHTSFLQLNSKNEEDDRMRSDSLFQHRKYIENVGAFASLKENSGVLAVKEYAENKNPTPPPPPPPPRPPPPADSLTCPRLKILSPERGVKKRGGGGGGQCSSHPALFTDQSRSQNKLTNPTFQMARKERRCWSPELHRRFLDALEKLGGSQVATPKQIREFMQVNGLTNDEVKSHLQKYRLHIRKLPSSPHTSSNGMLLGQVLKLEGRGIAKEEFPQSGSPESPFQLARSSTNCNSSGDSSMEEGDQKLDGHYSWKVHHHRP